MVGVDDDQPDTSQEYTIRTSPATSSDLHYHGMDPIDPRLTNLDDETAGFLVTPVQGLVTTESGEGVLVVEFLDEAGEQVARNASPFSVEPGRFTYRLVRAELAYEAANTTIEAHCRVGQGPTTVVPLTLLPPV